VDHGGGTTAAMATAGTEVGMRDCHGSGYVHAVDRFNHTASSLLAIQPTQRTQRNDARNVGNVKPTSDDR